MTPRSTPQGTAPVSDFAAALGFLTALPVGRTWPEGRMPRATGWYPWVGWVLGGVTTAILFAWFYAAGGLPTRGYLLIAVLVVTVWAASTRLLHWDGLADTADGLIGGSTREQRLAIMQDSRIGAFGAAAMLMVALLQVAAIADLIATGAIWVLVAAPVLGRLAVSLAAWQLPPAREDGLGRSVVCAPGGYEWGLAVASVLLLFLSMLLGASILGVVALIVVGVAAGIVVPRVLARSIGGTTGDLFGATILLVEAIVLVAGVALA